MKKLAMAAVLLFSTVSRADFQLQSSSNVDFNPGNQRVTKTIIFKNAGSEIATLLPQLSNAEYKIALNRCKNASPEASCAVTVISSRSSGLSRQIMAELSAGSVIVSLSRDYTAEVKSAASFQLSPSSVPLIEFSPRQRSKILAFNIENSGQTAAIPPYVLENATVAIDRCKNPVAANKTCQVMLLINQKVSQSFTAKISIPSHNQLVSIPVQGSAAPELTYSATNFTAYLPLASSLAVCSGPVQAYRQITRCVRDLDGLVVTDNELCQDSSPEETHLSPQGTRSITALPSGFGVYEESCGEGELTWVKNSATCSSGSHNVPGMECEANIRSCSTPLLVSSHAAAGLETYSGSAWPNVCAASSCVANYHLNGSACDIDMHTLSVAATSLGSPIFGSPGSAAYGTVVTLSYGKTSNSNFTWSEASCGSNTTCQVTLTADKTVSVSAQCDVNYHPSGSSCAINTNPLTLTPTTLGSQITGATSGSQINYGNVVTLSYTKAVNSTFTWSEISCGSNPTCAVTVNAAKTVSVSAACNPNHYSSGNQCLIETRNLTLTPPTLGSLITGNSGAIALGTTVTLSYTKASLSTFTWSQASCGSNPTCDVLMDTDKTISIAATCFSGATVSGTNCVVPAKLPVISNSTYAMVAGNEKGQFSYWGTSSTAATGNNPVTESYSQKTPTTTFSALTLTNSYITDYFISQNAYFAITSTGQLYSWGNNVEHGLLGQGRGFDWFSDNVPKLVSGMTGRIVTQVITGGNQSYGACLVSHLATDVNKHGSVYCWGQTPGFLGKGNADLVDRDVPTLVTALTNRSVAKIAATQNVICALTYLTADSTKSLSAYCWGVQTNGNMGSNLSGGNTYVPAAITATAALSGKVVTDIVATDQSFCVLAYASTDTTYKQTSPYCWGYNGSGQLGIGNTTTVSLPTAVDVTTAGTAFKDAVVTKLSTGNSFMCGMAYLKTDAAKNKFVACWGSNWEGSVGDQTTTTALIPKRVNSTLVGRSVTDITVGTWAVCARSYLTTDVNKSESLHCWGHKDNVGLGLTTNSPVPVLVTPVY